MTHRHFTRRQLIAGALAAAAALPAARLAHGAALPSFSAGERWLELVNLHTGETASVAFRDAAGFVARAVARLQHLLRDHRTNELHPIDPALFDQLADLAISAGREPRYEIISGYRSAHTNAQLNARSSGVAKRSLHMQGRAVDVRLTGFSTAKLRDLALGMQRGGVGYYARSNFVHLDTGRVRSWQG